MGPTPSSGGLGVLYLLGAAQGLFLAAVLASQRRNRTPNRLLAAVMAVFALDLAMAAYHASGLYATLPALIGLDYPLGFLYGPLLYLYFRTLTEPGHQLRRRDALHLVPFALLVAGLLPYYALDGAAKLAALDAPADPRTRVLAVVNGLKLVQGLAYVGLVVGAVRRHRRRWADAGGAPERATLDWLRTLTVGVVALMGLSLGLYLVGVGEVAPVMGLDPTGLADDLTLLGVTAFVYAIGFLGLRRPEVFAPPLPAAAPVEARPRYAKSGMDEATAAHLEAALVALMAAERPYHRGDLTLQELADALGVSPHNLTEVVNTRLGQTFYDFVNGYRVREAQARLVDPAFAHWTVLAVGLEAGFNSKSSFHAAFKRHTGQTPSGYREGQGVVA